MVAVTVHWASGESVEVAVSEPEPPAVQEKIADLVLVETLCEMWRQSPYRPIRGHFNGVSRCLVGMVLGENINVLPIIAYRRAAGAVLGRSESFGSGLEQGWEVGQFMSGEESLLGNVLLGNVLAGGRDYLRGYAVGAEVARRVLG